MVTKQLNGVYLFEHLDATELKRLEAICTARTVAIGEHVFSHGDASDALYVVNYGTIRIHRGGAVVDDIGVAMLGTGSHFGELGFLDGGKRSATATAMERTELTRIEYGSLARTLEHTSSMGLKVYRALAQRIGGALRETTDDLLFARDTSARRSRPTVFVSTPAEEC